MVNYGRWPRNKRSRIRRLRFNGRRLFGPRGILAMDRRVIVRRR